jgi:hypothetical protein
VNGGLKAFARSRLQFLVLPWRYLRNFRLLGKSTEQVFTAIFLGNTWGRSADSRSGPGSSLPQTQAIRRTLPALIEELRCRSLLDIPCGDFSWMSRLDLEVDYTGGDIVRPLIDDNQRNYGGPRRKFLSLDLLRDSLPRADLVLCRDCLVHFSYRDIFRALRAIRSSGGTWLLTTSFASRTRNEDIPTGSWRPLNLVLPPFCLPLPQMWIDEECPRDDCRDKGLALWKIADLPDEPLSAFSRRRRRTRSGPEAS